MAVHDFGRERDRKRVTEVWDGGSSVASKQPVAHGTAIIILRRLGPHLLPPLVCHHQYNGWYAIL